MICPILNCMAELSLIGQPVCKMGMFSESTVTHPSRTSGDGFRELATNSHSGAVKRHSEVVPARQQPGRRSVLINLIHFCRGVCCCSWRDTGSGPAPIHYMTPGPETHQILKRFPRQLTFTRQPLRRGVGHAVDGG